MRSAVSPSERSAVTRARPVTASTSAAAATPPTAVVVPNCAVSRRHQPTSSAGNQATAARPCRTPRVMAPESGDRMSMGTGAVAADSNAVGMPEAFA